MMNTPHFDTDEFIQALAAANMPTEQARILARTYANTLNEHVATKSDIVLLEKDIERIDGKIDALEKSMVATINAGVLRSVFLSVGLLCAFIALIEFGIK